MAGRISEMVAASALDGTELVEVTQGTLTRRTTTADVAALGGGGGGFTVADLGAGITSYRIMYGAAFTQIDLVNITGAGYLLSASAMTHTTQSNQSIAVSVFDVDGTSIAWGVGSILTFPTIRFESSLHIALRSGGSSAHPLEASAYVLFD